jgi:hypothetical protein
MSNVFFSSIGTVYETCGNADIVAMVPYRVMARFTFLGIVSYGKACLRAVVVPWRAGFFIID